MTSRSASAPPATSRVPGRERTRERGPLPWPVLLQGLVGLCAIGVVAFIAVNVHINIIWFAFMNCLNVRNF